MKLRQVLAVAMVLVMLLSSLLVMSIPTAKAATPSVISVSPPDDATDVKLLTEVQMAFNVPMNETSLRPAFALDKGGQPVDGTLYIGTTVDGLGYLDFAPSEALQPGTEYTVTVRANATDMQGNAMGEAFTSVFTTEGGQNNTTSQLQIISPNGLEDWKWWNTQEIKWSSSGIGDLVHLSVVSANHSTTIWDIGDVPNTGSYSFYLDQNLQTAYGGGLLSDNGIVARVTSLDGSVEDFSDRPFFASYDGMDQGSANAIQFVTPTYVPYNPLDPVNLIPASDAAIGYYAPRSKCRIAWVTSEEVGSPLQLSLMHKNADGTAELVQLISDSVPSSNTADYNEFTFTMPYVVADWQTSSKDYCLELREASSGQVEYSHWFGLGPVAALLSVTSPNGGERWEVGKQYDIQWNYDVGGQNPNPWFYVQVLRASDLSVVQDMGYVQGTNSYAWIIPSNFAPGDYLVQVDSCCSGPIDRSNASFSVVAPNYTGPSVTSIAPDNGTTGVDTGTSIQVTFSEAMDTSSVEEVFNLSNMGPKLSGSFAWSADGTAMTFTPSSPLSSDKTYWVSMENAGGRAAKDLNANEMASFYSQFTTTSGVQDVVVNVTSPTGGETWRIGETQEINWSVILPSGASMLDQEVYLMNSNGLDKIAVLGPDERSFSWTIPSYNVEYLTESWIQVQAHVQELSGEAYHLGKSSNFALAASPDNDAPVISNVYPESPLKLYTSGTSVTLGFGASYSDNVNVISATVTMDDVDVSDEWGVTTSQLSYYAQLPMGNHSIMLTVKDAAGNEARQVWNVDVNQDSVSPVISEVKPSSPLTLYTKATSVTQNFAASYSDDVGVTKVMAFLDEVNMTEQWTFGTSSFSQDAQLGLGKHTLVLKVRDAVANEALQTWDITVIQDTTPPTIFGYTNGQQIKDTTATPTIGASFSDSGSGIDAARTTVGVDGQNMTKSATISATGFTYPTSQLSTGKHTITVQVWDKAGNTAIVSWSVQVMAKTPADSTPPIIKSVAGTFNKKTSIGTITATYSDAGSGVNANTVYLFVDGVNLTKSCTIAGSQISYSSASLTKGSSHSVHLELKDNAGNLASQDATLTIK